MHETFTRFVRRSLGGLSEAEQTKAQRASAHWLRHTHATRAAERKVPLDVLQEIGCGLAGYRPTQIVPMFHDAPANCELPPEFISVLSA